MNWKSFFSLSIRRYFRWNLLIVIIFFLLACVACLCLHTAWPREEESRFNVSFNVTLDANNDLSACRLVLLSYTLPRCLIKFDYSCACKLAQVKAGARESRSDFRTAVSSRVFFYVDLRLWFISRKKKLRSSAEDSLWSYCYCRDGIETSPRTPPHPPHPHLWTYTAGVTSRGKAKDYFTRTLLCLITGMTAMAKQAKSGREHHKPQWTNKERVSSIILTCRMFISRNI